MSMNTKEYREENKKQDIDNWKSVWFCARKFTLEPLFCVRQLVERYKKKNTKIKH